MQEEEQPKKIDLSDDKIAEITRKISGSRDTSEIFAKMNEVGQGLTDTTDPLVHQEVVIKNLRTYQGDVAEAIKNQNASVLTITLAEKKKKDKEEALAPKQKDPEKGKKIVSIVLSVLLIVLGVGTVVGFYFLQKQAPTPAIQTPGPAPEETIVGYNTKKSISVDSATREKFISVMNGERLKGDINANETVYVFLNKNEQAGIRPLTTKELFSILNTKIPGATLRSFADQFMFGFFQDERTEPFLLIRISSYENAFDGMLKWEETLKDDIGTLFLPAAIPGEISAQNSESTSTQTTTNQLPPLETGTINKTFEDETIRNKDARVLKNANGDVLMLYSFLDKQTLLITSNENTLKEMINKLISQKLVR